jgi:hypothetical protein
MVVSKYLKVFKKLQIDNEEYELQWDILGPLIVNNVKKLNEIDFYSSELIEEHKSYVEELLKNSNKTLTKISYAAFPLPNIPFPNLIEIDAYDIDLQNSFQEFKNSFPHLLKNCESIERVKISLGTNCRVVCEYIGKYYAKHCISSSHLHPTMLEYVPLKILTHVWDLNSLQHKRYTNELEYVKIGVNVFLPMERGWDRYQEIFDQCNKLKQIAFDFYDENFRALELSDLVEDEFNNFNLWNQRIVYFKKRGIQIVNKNKISRNKVLQAKIAKEIGIKWRFHFW